MLPSKKYMPAITVFCCWFIISVFAHDASASPAYPALPRALAVTHAAEIQQTAAGALITFQPANWPHLLFQAQQPWNWNHKALCIVLTNPGSKSIQFGVRVDDSIKADGWHHCRSGTGELAPGQTAVFSMPIDLRPADYGVKGLPALPNTLPIASIGASDFDPAHIVAIQIFLSHPAASRQLLLKNISLSNAASLKGCTDQFGQYTGEQWPGKVLHATDLLKQRKAEDKWLQSHPPFANRDEYGGWANGPVFHATGYFRTRRFQGKWYFVDPLGHLFLSFGIDCIQDQYPTFLTQRRSWFCSLPAKNSPLARFNGTNFAFMGPVKSGKTFDFFQANLYRKYGPNYNSIWFNRDMQRLKSWGFNTIGNWSDPAAYALHQLPFVVTISIPHKTTVSSGSDYWGKMPDPFDPLFAHNAAQTIDAAMAPYKLDPWCLGAFVDNELSWKGNGIYGNIGLALGALHESASASPAKQAFLQQLQSEYSSIQAFNTAWHTQLQHRTDLLPPLTAPAKLTKQAEADCRKFVHAYAVQYFKVISAAFHNAAPNNLYLGCRFAWFTKGEAKAAAKYCDVVSFNIYQPQITASQWGWLSQLHKPCIIGEFHSGALDRGMWMPGLVQEPNQQGRASMFTNYVRSVAENPALVGCHWFELVDEPLTGRTWDGENYNIGFLACTDRPYTHLVEAARRILGSVYTLRASFIPQKSHSPESTIP